MALAGRGDFDGVDEQLDVWAGADDDHRPPAWCRALWAGMRALAQGRFHAAERSALHAAAADEADDDARAHAGLLLAYVRREQGRPAEAEVILRELAARPSSLLGARVAWAALLGELGRDSAARRELRALAGDDFGEVRDDPGWLPAMCRLAELSVVVDSKGGGGSLYRHLAPYSWRFAVEPVASVCHGSVSGYLGLLAQASGRWDDAALHFEQALEHHGAAGAPVLAAHTRSRYAALLRARGDDDDWDRAIALVSEAEAIYRRLGIEPAAVEARELLARSQEPDSPKLSGPYAWRLGPDGWLLEFGGRSATLPDSKGMHDLARLLANPGHSFHVVDLWAGTGRGVAKAGTGPGWLGIRVGGLSAAREAAPSSAAAREAAPSSAAAREAAPASAVPVAPTGSVPPDARTRAECQARLEELDEEISAARAANDSIRMSLARAERDLVAGELAAEPPGDDPVDRVRHLVALRIGRDLDRVAEAHPELGRHLRLSVRTGTFCSYEPVDAVRWAS